MDCPDKYRVFGIDELKEVMEGFSSKCPIQRSVYKGCVDGKVFAIKKKKWNAYEELKVLQKVSGFLPSLMPQFNLFTVDLILWFYLQYY
ncbi:hypothetical protein NL676_021066 [Syzygium grande]|nr:hypothetical protein NL676_021066 [Syzygium grande]